MELKQNIHLAYCTNIHRGQDWPTTFQTLQDYALAVRDRVSPGRPYAIGLRLSDQASRELSDKQTLLDFQRWLEKEQCYIFTINGFPYGTFHGGRVKELAYVPDWTTPERVEYTKRLFDLLAELVPPGLEGSVSTVPGSFKPLIKTQDQVDRMRANLWETIGHIEKASQRSQKILHLGLEPEPLCYLETSQEAVDFLDQMHQDRPSDERLHRYLGINYDCCHMAVEHEDPHTALDRYRSRGIRISKLHFSSAMKVVPTDEARAALKAFIDPVYFHQVVARTRDGSYTRYLDLDEALAAHEAENSELAEEEWRIHFHIPLHCQPTPLFETTQDHLFGVMDILAREPALCSHVEMETYTWEVLPPEMKNRNVVDQLTSEYEWTLRHLRQRDLA